MHKQVDKLLSMAIACAGHWVEVAFPDADSQLSCQTQCQLHPEATAFQYNDDGWCGCMVLADGVVFEDAIASGEHLGPWSECTICDIRSICHYEVCHNDGHWQEVAFPSDVQDISGCRDACIASGQATAFQFNDDGWCGCMALADGVTFEAAIAGEHIGPWTECESFMPQLHWCCLLTSAWLPFRYHLRHK